MAFLCRLICLVALVFCLGHAFANPPVLFAMQNFIDVNTTSGVTVYSTRLVMIDMATGELKSCTTDPHSGLGRLAGAQPPKGITAEDRAVIFAHVEDNHDGVRTFIGFDLATHKEQPPHNMSSSSSGIIFAETFSFAGWQMVGAALDLNFPARTTLYTIEAERGTLVHVATLEEKYPYQANMPLAIAVDSHSELNRTIYLSALLVGRSAQESAVKLYAVNIYTGEIDPLPARPRTYPDERTAALVVHPRTGHLLVASSNDSGAFISELNVVTGQEALWLQLPGVQLGRCHAVDAAARRWYIGCDTIFTIDLDNGQVLARTQLQLPPDSFIAGLTLEQQRG